MRLPQLIAVFVLAHVAYSGNRLTLSLLVLDRGASVLMLGVLLGSMGLGPMLLSVHLGRWTDRVGIRMPCILGLVLLLAGTLVGLLAQGTTFLVAAAVLMGSGFMLVHLAVNNAVGQGAAADKRTRAFSILAVGNSVSTTLGPLTAGAAIDVWGHRGTLVLLAGSALAALALTLAGTPKAGAAVAPRPAKALQVRELWGDPALRAVLIASALTTMSWDVFNFLMPLNGKRLELSSSTIGLIMGAFGLATLFARAAVPWLVGRVSEWRMLSGAVWISVLVYAVMPMVTAVPWLLVLVFLLGLGLGIAQPSVMSLIHQTAPEGRTAEAVGIRTMLMNTGVTLLPLTAGIAGLSLGLTPIFWGFAASVFAGGLYAFRSGEVTALSPRR